MKKTAIVLAVFLFVVLTLTSCLTMKKEDVGTYQQIAEFPEQTREELYSRARSWFVEAFVSSDAVIEQDDKDAYILKGKYTDSVQRNMLCEVDIESVITVEIKEGKVRMTISEPLKAIAIVGTDRSSTDLSSSEVEKINEHRQALFESLKTYLSSEVEDW